MFVLMKKIKTVHSAHYCGLMHLSEIAQSRILEQTIENFEISSSNLWIVSYIKFIQNKLSKMLCRPGICGTFGF